MALGFDAKGIRASPNSLMALPKPAILHLATGNKSFHFVVLFRYQKRYLQIMDPADGAFHRVPHDDFEAKWTGAALILMPGLPSGKFPKPRSARARFWSLIGPHRALFAQAFLGALIYTLLGFSMSIYLQKLTDHVFVNGSANLLNLLSVIMLILLALQGYITVYKDLMLVRLGQIIDLRLILGYYRHLLELPQSFFDTMRVGELLSRVSDAMKIRNFISALALNLLVSLLTLIFSFCFLLVLHWKLALIIMLVIPLYIALYAITNHLNRNTERKVIEASASLESQMVESLTSLRNIRQLGMKETVFDAMENRFLTLLSHTYLSARHAVLTANSSSLLTAFITVILLWTGSHFVLEGELTPGELLSCYAILAYFTAPVGRLINANREIQNALIAADRLFEILEMKCAPSPPSKIKKWNRKGDIVFHHVSFQYTGGARVLSDLNLTIRNSRITALTGANGCGKTTLFQLLCQIYPPGSGSIFWGSVNLRYLDTDLLRMALGVVPQETRLFHGNLIENLAPGQRCPDMDRIYSLALGLGLRDFIEKLPEGFQTCLGEEGRILSGGQRQRIALARALYHNPHLLLLDEVTTAIDCPSQEIILDFLKTLRTQGKTIVIITHQPEVLEIADDIVRLENGRVVDPIQMAPPEP